MNKNSVAVEGIGFGPLATATQGYQANNEISLTQNVGIISGENFSVSSCSILLNNTVAVNSQEQCGISQTLIHLESTGIDTQENFGTSIAVYDQTLNQINGIDSAEQFGISNVQTTVQNIVERPRHLVRRGGSSSSSSSSVNNVSVIAEMVNRSINENSYCNVRGVDNKSINLRSNIVIAARAYHVKDKEELTSFVEVKAWALKNKITKETPEIQVRAEMISKVA